MQGHLAYLFALYTSRYVFWHITVIIQFVYRSWHNEYLPVERNLKDRTRDVQNKCKDYNTSGTNAHINVHIRIVNKHRNVADKLG